MRHLDAIIGMMRSIRTGLSAGVLSSAHSAIAKNPSSSDSSVDGTDKEQGPLIVQAGDPVLRSRAAEVAPERIKTPEMQELVRIMIASMRRAPGVGLAAPQIGIPLRVFVLEDRPEYLAKLTDEKRRELLRVPFEARTFFNPTLRVIGDERATFLEGCLSVSGFVALVERALEVEVSGLDEHGDPHHWRTRGWPARILQHEFDHLEGTLYIDRMHTRSFASVEQANQFYAGKPVDELRRLLGV